MVEVRGKDFSVNMDLGACQDDFNIIDEIDYCASTII